MNFEVYEDKVGEWRFRLKSKNGKIIAVGEGYKRKSSAFKVIDKIIKGILVNGQNITIKEVYKK